MMIAPPTKSSILPPPILVTDSNQLQLCIQVLSDSKAIAIDTEFMRTDTFFPILGLVQIFNGDNCWLIVLFEGGDIVYGREESGGLIYVPLRSIRNQTIYRFETRFQKPYNLWGGLKDGFGIDLLWFGLGNKNTKSKTLNYSRRGFTNV